MYKLLQELSDQEKKPMSHFVNMALYEYKPITQLDIYRDWWKCDQRDCAVLNPPAEEKCKKCGQRALWSIIKEHNDRMTKYK
jgi:ribosomal protein L40E